MKVFYYCNTGYHLALIAGNIHLGILPRTKRPTTESISSLKYFGFSKDKEIGRIINIGKTNDGHEIYAFGALNEQELAKKAVDSLLEELGIDKTEYLLVDAHKYLNTYIKLGIQLEGIFGNRKLGNKLIAYGLEQNYVEIVENIEKTEEKIRN